MKDSRRIGEPDTLSFVDQSTPAAMTTLEFSLSISPDEVLRYYRGEVQIAIAKLDDGRTVQFPAAALSRVVTENGVQGRFQLVCDDNHKFHSLRQL